MGISKGQRPGEHIVILDVHTHLWPPESTPASMAGYFATRGTGAVEGLTHEGLLASMEDSGIDHSVVVAMAFDATSSNEALAPLNAYVRDAVAKSGGRLTGFSTVNPFEGGRTLRALRRSIEDDGFRGLKLHGNIQEFYPNDRRLYPIYAAMQEYGFPILFHSGGIGVRPYRDKYGDPVAFDDIACDFPELPIILGHAGRTWYDSTAMLLRKHPHVHAEVSTNFGRDEKSRLVPMARLFEAVRGWAGTTNNLLFGSDHPLYPQRATVEGLRALEEACRVGTAAILEPEDVRRVLDVNSARFAEAYGLTPRGPI